MEIHGKIIAMPAIERGVGARGPWARAYAVVEYESGQYPRSILLQNSKDAERFAQLHVGDIGTFKFDTKTREFNGKWYTDIICWSWSVDQQHVDEPF